MVQPRIDAVVLGMAGPQGPPGMAASVAVGRYIGPLATGPGVTGKAARAMTANLCYLTPFIIPEAMSFDQMGAYVSTKGATGNLRIALYATGPDGLPGDYIAGVSITTIAGSGAASMAVTTPVLPAGLYWALVYSDAAHSLNAATSVTASIGVASIGYTTRACEWQYSRPYGAMPTTFTGAALTEVVSNEQFFLTYFRRAS